ncbi:MAG: hypothetical protein HC769_03480 [Cyanobacteria bacterium CRU_2_1]|nr:hypothetical protein [Cyanobacteria bacterium RU_5_0]NJR57990.1 hypothetical protein [Cyanobacteria bacterium CRU_2_1]
MVAATVLNPQAKPSSLFVVPASKKAELTAKWNVVDHKLVCDWMSVDR